MESDVSISKVNHSVLNEKGEYSLDTSVISSKKMKGMWNRNIWIFWGSRPYQRNINDEAHFVMGVIQFFLAVLSVIFYIYFPLHIFGIMVFLAMNGLVIFYPISYANKTCWAGVLNIAIGATGLITHWHFDLTIFGYHIESYFFWAYLGSGVLTLYRRGWNAVIWHKLDKIVLQYYRDNALDTSLPAKPISNYNKAYQVLSKRACELLDLLVQKEKGKEHVIAISLILKLLSNETEDGLKKALSMMDKEIKHARGN